MADVFISYSQEDRPVAKALGDFLNKHGYDIWWDYDLVGGVNFRKAIKEELAAAKAAIVIWTAHSIESDWVLDEAQEAKDAKKLIPTRIEELDLRNIPHGFRSLQTDLVTEPERMLKALAKLGVSPSRDRAEEAESWDRIKDSDDISALVAHLKRFPDGLNAPAARSKRESLQRERDAAERWRNISSGEDPAVFEEFLKTYAGSRFEPNARERLDELNRAIEDARWNEVRCERHPAPLLRFLVAHPGGAHADEAVAMLRNLPKAIEEDAWAAIKDSHEPIVLRGFLAGLPQSDRGREVQTRLKTAAATSRPSPQPPAPAPIRLADDKVKLFFGRAFFWIAVAVAWVIVLAETISALSEMRSPSGVGIAIESVGTAIATASAFLAVLALLLFFAGPRLHPWPTGPLVERMLPFHAVGSIGIAFWIWVTQSFAEANYVSFGTIDNVRAATQAFFAFASLAAAVVALFGFLFRGQWWARIAYYLVVLAIGVVEFSRNVKGFPAREYWVTEDLYFCGGLALLLFSVVGVIADLVTQVPARTVAASGSLPPAA